MKKTVLKLFVFVMFIVAVMTLNNFVINGPLLQSNTDLSVKQFKDTPAPAGDFQIAGYWVTFNVVYVVEALMLALIGFLMFVGDFLKILLPVKE